MPDTTIAAFACANPDCLLAYGHIGPCTIRHPNATALCTTENCIWKDTRHLGECRLRIRAGSEPETVDMINHPRHYNAHPSGIECIDVVEHMNFNIGNAIKYLWRADEKGNALEDLQKAEWYVRREITRRTGGNEASTNRTSADATPS